MGVSYSYGEYDWLIQLSHNILAHAWNVKTEDVESVSCAMIVWCFVFGPPQSVQFIQNKLGLLYLTPTSYRLHLQGAFFLMKTYCELSCFRNSVASNSSGKWTRISRQPVMHFQLQLSGIPFIIRGLSCVPTDSSGSVGCVEWGKGEWRVTVRLVNLLHTPPGATHYIRPLDTRRFIDAENVNCNVSRNVWKTFVLRMVLFWCLNACPSASCASLLS